MDSTSQPTSRASEKIASMSSIRTCSTQKASWSLLRSLAAACSSDIAAAFTDLHARKVVRSGGCLQISPSNGIADTSPAFFHCCMTKPASPTGRSRRPPMTWRILMLEPSSNAKTVATGWNAQHQQQAGSSKRVASIAVSSPCPPKGGARAPSLFPSSPLEQGIVRARGTLKEQARNWARL
jgi:hypothetical protein